MIVIPEVYWVRWLRHSRYKEIDINKKFWYSSIREVLKLFKAELANKLQIPCSVEEKLTILVANGEQIFCKGFCKDDWLALQSHETIIVFYLLQLKHYNVGLGAWRLSILGPILWNFAKLTMSFKLDSSVVNLQGHFSLWTKYWNQREWPTQR